MKKRLISALTVLCLALSLIPSFAMAAEGELSGMTAVIYTANVRGDISVYPKVEALDAQFRAKGAQTVKADLGNYLQGSVYASADCGETVAELMNGIYDTAVIGQHEFDWNNSSLGTKTHGDFVQYKNLFQLADEVNFMMISSNIKEKDEDAFAPSATVSTESGLKIAFVGITAPQNERVFPDDCAIFNNLTFLEKGDMTKAAENAAKTAAKTADVVIALSNTAEPVENIAGADAVINAPAADTASAGVMLIDKDGRIISDEAVDLAAVKPLESELSARVEDIMLANKDAKFAKTDVVLRGQNQAACKGETNLGDLWTDALRWFAASGKIAEYYDEDDITAGNKGIAVDSDHIVALWNGGNLKADINAGSVTETDMKAVLPYPNKVAVVYMTGSQLLEALEAAGQGLPFTQETASVCNSFMQVSGLKYTVDADKPFAAGEAYGKHWHKAESVTRTEITEVNGKAFDAEAVYAVITSNANFNGMDSSYIFTEAAAADERSTITTAVVRDVIWQYIKSELDSQIDKAYAEPQGRITVNASEQAKNPFTDVSRKDWFYDEVLYVADKGIMTGTGEGIFEPFGKTSRAMMVTILYRMEGAPQVETSDTSWYGAARQWAMDNKISDGTDMGGNITREQIAAMLYRYTNDAQAGHELKGFADSDKVSSWAEDAMGWAVSEGIIQGNDKLELNPSDPALRSEMAAMVMRYTAGK